MNKLNLGRVKGDQGPQGYRGPQGPQGPQGIQGPQGDIGPQGPKGVKGDTGPQGDIGPQGPKGDQGDVGPQGDKGYQGVKGDTGPQGDIGPQGPKGDQGDTGPQGPPVNIDIISQAEAEAGVSAEPRTFTAQRVRQAIVAWFNGISGALGRTILTRTTADQVRGDIGLGTAATRDVGTGVGHVLANSNASLMGAIVSAHNNTDSTGFWEITLPYEFNSMLMLAFQIKEYSSYRLSTIDVSGFLYYATNNWYLPRCMISGETPPTVRFGRNAAGYAVIVVSTGQYSGIGVYDVVSGYKSPLVNLYGTTITRHTTQPDHTYVSSNTIHTYHTGSLLQTAPVVVADNATVTLTNGRAVYAVNTTSAARTLTLPASPPAGATVTVIDYANTCGINALTIARNGRNIEGAAANVALTQNGQRVEMVYIDAAQGWKIISSYRHGGFI